MNKASRRILFLCNTAILLLAFSGIVFFKHYSSDDIFCIYHQNSEGLGVIIMSGRLVMGILYILLDLLHINVVTWQIPFGLVMILCFSGAVTMLTSEFLRLSEHCEHPNSAAAAVNAGNLLIFLNPLIVECTWFALAYLQWGISALFSVFAAIRFAREPSGRSSLRDTTLLLSISVFCYQTAVVYYIFFVVGLLYVRYGGQLNRERFLQILLAAVPAVGTMLLNLLFLKLISLLINLFANIDISRLSLSAGSLIFAAKQFLYTQYSLLVYGYHLFPRYVLLLFAFFLVFAVLYRILRCAGKASLLFVLSAVLPGFFALFLLSCSQQSVNLPARMLVPVLCVFPVLIWIFCCASGKAGLRICCAASVLLLCINLWYIGLYTQDIQVTTKRNAYECTELSRAIAAYEAENQVEIRKVGFLQDANPTQKYYDAIYSKDYQFEFVLNGLFTDWSDQNSLNFYSGRQFVREDNIPQAAAEYFSGVDISVFSPGEQILFLGDTAYICLY